MSSNPTVASGGMLPHAFFNDAGTGTNGTIYGGPFVGPDTEQSTNLTYFDITRDCYLDDAISQLASGTATASQHAYLVSIGNVQNVVFYILSTQTPPNSNLRVVPNYHFARGSRIFIRGVQLSGTSGGTEATQLIMAFSSRPH